MIGVLILLLAPWLTRVVTTADRWLSRILLGSGSLSARVPDLEEKRVAVLRYLES